MMKHLLLSASLAIGMTLIGDIVTLPAPVPCGQITEFIRTEDAQKFVDINAAAKAAAEADTSTEDGTPSMDVPEELLVEKEPENGMLFAIFTVKVTEGRTLSQYDYALETDSGTRQSCLGIGYGKTGFFDFRMRAQQGPELYKLIFHCPKEAYEVKLIYAYPKIPVPPVGDFVINVRPAPPTPPPAPAEPAPAAAAPANAPAPAAPATPANAPAPATPANAPAPAAAPAPATPAAPVAPATK